MALGMEDDEWLMISDCLHTEDTDGHGWMSAGGQRKVTAFD